VAIMGGNVSVAFVACAVADMTVRSSRRRLRIRLRCVRSSDRRTFACVRRPATTTTLPSTPLPLPPIIHCPQGLATAASSPSETALASSGLTTAPSPTSAYALCPRQLKHLVLPVHACEPSALRGSAVCDSVVSFVLRSHSVRNRPQRAAQSWCRRTPRHHPTGPLSGIGEGGRRRERCAACGVQANYGGLVGIFGSSTGHVSVVGSTVANITVRAHCRVTP
jgi:hypothetical protein